MNKRPTNGEVCIVDYEPKYKDAWHDLNAQWITQYWQLEPHDLEVLGNPQESIIDKGGYIFVALYEGKPVGVCALCTIDNPKYDYEFAKLAVAPEMRGYGIGRMIATAVIDKAKALGARNVFIESNKLLTTAINLYHSLGFEDIELDHPSYDRGDIQLVLRIG